MLKVCVAGATGWAGRAVAEAVLAADDLELVSAVARRGTGRDLGDVWGTEKHRVPIYATVAAALDAGDAMTPSLRDRASELAEKLAAVRPTEMTLPVRDTAGHNEARGAAVAGTRAHSLRLPSFSVSTEVIFALPDERLSIRHDAGSTAAPYVTGTLLAARAAPTTIGLIRGLETLLLAST
jgi:dihydrodipicolinate reductase